MSMAARWCRFDDGAELAFQSCREEGIGPFFPHLRFRTKGPILHPGLADRLYSRRRIFSGLMTLAFVCFNFWTISVSWWRAMRKPKVDAYAWSSQSNRTITELVGADLVPIGTMPWQSDGNVLHLIVVGMASYELLAMIVMLLEVVRILFVHGIRSHGGMPNWLEVCCGRHPLSSYKPWWQFYHAICHTLPTMSNFSAMKGLEYWNPQLLSEAFTLETKAFTWICAGVLFFIMTHFCIGLIGFIAFCTKFANVVDMLVDEKEAIEKNGAFFCAGKQALVLMAFCNQIFGITQIWRVQERRLLLFLFGGPDADFTEEEICREDAFLAEITRAVCQDMFQGDTSKMKFSQGIKLHLKRITAILTFSHLDVQAFMLEEKPDRARPHRVSMLSSAREPLSQVEMPQTSLPPESPQHWS